MKIALHLSLAATLLAATPASAYVGIFNFERTSHLNPASPPMPLGPADQSNWGYVRINSGAGANEGVCIVNWPTSVRFGPKVAVGMNADGTCNPTQPLRIKTNGSAYLVSAHIIGNNPAGWRVTAFDLAKNQIVQKRVLQGTNPGRMTHYVWIADPNAKIATVYIEPWDNSNPNLRIGLDEVAIGQGGLAASEDVEE